MKELIIGKNDGGQRLDRFLSKALPHLPPSLIARLIRKKHFRVNGKHVPADFHLTAGDVLALYLSDEQLTPPPEEEEWRLARGEVIIAYEDENILIADKPSGLLCHGDEKGNPDTLINRIKKHLVETGDWKPKEENSFVPALANRIDRNTSGLVLAAKNAETLRVLNELIKDRKIGKYYLCTVKGRPSFREKTLTGWLEKDPATNTVRVHRSPAPGRLTAITHVKVLSQRGDIALLECELGTGRTHQIRAQLAAEGLPITGDTKYGRDAADGRGQNLCSYKVVFPKMTGILAYLSEKSIISSFVSEFDVPDANKKTRAFKSI